MTEALCRPFCQNVNNCAAVNAAYHCKPCGYVKKVATQKANKKPKPIPLHCRKPDACAAKGDRHCHSCATFKLHAERPEAMARAAEAGSARLKACNSDPAFIEKIKAGKRASFSRRHGVPERLLPVVRKLSKKGYNVKEAAAIVRRDLVKGA